jgi:hypothetical protein
MDWLKNRMDTVDDSKVMKGFAIAATEQQSDLFGHDYCIVMSGWKCSEVHDG